MFKSLLTAFTNLFKKPHTLNYPKKDIKLPKDYRGLIEYNEDACIFCDACEKACPPKAIVFSQHEDGSKEYKYNPYLCIYCGECVRACPKAQDALWQSEKKQLAGKKEDDVNHQWRVWQDEAAASREKYAAIKKAAKEKKAQEAQRKKEQEASSES
jgi:NADH-quinone oxidoreductase subunit I